LPVRRKGVFAPGLRQRVARFEPGNMERAHKGQGQRLLAGVGLLLLLGHAPGYAATINVGGQCTLARAIAAANSDATADGVCTSGRGADTIVMPPNRVQPLFRVHNTVYGPTGLPVIRTHISIDGNGATIIRHPRAPKFRIFAVAKSGRLTLTDLTIRGGFAVGLGGGALRSLGVVRLVDVVVDDNRALGNGGGLWVQNVVSIRGSKFTRNQSACPLPATRAECNGGGGFYRTGQPTPGQTEVPSLEVDSSTFSGNQADAQGGGLQVNGNATINDSELADNSAQQGGAIAVGTQLADIIRDRLEVAAVTAPAPGKVSIAALPASVQITNTTLTDNVATVSGGGLVVGGSSDVTLNNTVVSGNSAPRGREAVAQPGAFVDVDNFNTLGFGGNAGVVGFALGPTDTVATQPPVDPTPEELPPSVVSDLPPPLTEQLLPGEEPPPATVETPTTPPVETPTTPPDDDVLPDNALPSDDNPSFEDTPSLDDGLQPNAGPAPDTGLPPDNGGTSPGNGASPNDESPRRYVAW
jgi:hypothetical protein